LIQSAPPTPVPEPAHTMSITRRQALRRTALTAAGLALADRAASAAASASAAATGTARSVIQIWMWGGPAHLDTFDPKPEAGPAYCGPLDQPIATNVDGIRIGQLLPQLAKLADKFSIIRSLTHGENAHETAAYIVQTGHRPDRLLYPSLGAIVSRLRGYEAGYRGLVPPYVVLTTPQGRFSEAGFLGPRYKPFATGGDPARDPFAVEGIVAQGITRERQQQRRRLLQQLDTLGRALPANPEFELMDRCGEQAYEMILGDAGTLFDLAREPAATRERYGRNTFGQSCLMARRLVESGVPYITINSKGWDTHKQHFQTMQRRLPEMDQGFAALLADLAERGLLDTTVVWWGGEFGRTPKILHEPPWNGGRNHFGNAFCAVLAGGGFRGGQVVGATDATGSEVAERPVYPHDVLASILLKLGIDPDAQLPNPRGLDLRIMPATIEGFGTDGGRLVEIM
jgi:hypothetical protein